MPRANSRLPRSSPRPPSALSAQPQAMQLRYLQTLLDVSTGSSGQNSTIIFPLPMDLIKPLMAKLEADKG